MAAFTPCICTLAMPTALPSLSSWKANACPFGGASSQITSSSSKWGSVQHFGKVILPHHRSWRGSKFTVVVKGEAATEEGEKQGMLTKDELLMLRKKVSDMSSYLQGSSIFLVGMSKSGKSTVGKCLSEALGYYFFDSQQLVEQAAGEQLSQMEEEELRSAESEVLMQLSPLMRLIVATDEHAVMSSRNWGYLKSGVSVWLDWPVESLVQRMASSQEDALLENMRKGLQEKSEFYANADAVVSMEKIAALKHVEDLNSLTPPIVAFHVLDEIDNVLKKADKVFYSKRYNKEDQTAK
ncbi:hypothetical protein R1sor_022063 [Riccia sorocarpa]|uniref:Shikimate kinase n=1 Tax=Riccia sorocarpa TaxID=122646 RepID=A0ABD3GKR1_9MARC